MSELKKHGTKNPPEEKPDDSTDSKKVEEGSILYISDNPWIGVHYEVNLDADIVSMAKEIVTKHLNSKLVINIETPLVGKKRSDHPLVDLVILLLFKKPEYNIVCVGFEPLDAILRRRPIDLVLFAPGVTYQQLCKRDKIAFQPIQITQRVFLKKYLKPRVDAILSDTRHNAANFAGMIRMINISLELYQELASSDQNTIITDDKLFTFLKSVDYFLLKEYFSLAGKSSKLAMNELQIDKSITARKNILLVDDLASSGWKGIVGQMIYQEPGTSNLQCLDAPEENHDWPDSLGNAIKTHKPHLILLDLRLKDQTGKVPIEEQEGYILLKWLKNHSVYKGIPVVMFTATTNAAVVKRLIKEGAEAVWTKPGLDEELTTESTFNRYKELIDCVKDVFSEKRFEDLKMFDQEALDYEQLSYLQGLLMEKLESIKYLLALNGYDAVRKIEMANIHHDFVELKLEDYNFIYFDTNALIPTSTTLHYSDALVSLVLLSVSTNNYSYKFIKKQSGKETNKYRTLPRVVIMHAVYDELLKLGKSHRNPKTRCLASTSLVVINMLLNAGYVRFDLGPKPEQTFRNPKENQYADPFILDELSNILSSKLLGKIKVDERIDTIYEYQDKQNVLFICDDYFLKKKVLSFSRAQENYITISDSENIAQKLKAALSLI